MSARRGLILLALLGVSSRFAATGFCSTRQPLLRGAVEGAAPAVSHESARFEEEASQQTWALPVAAVGAAAVLSLLGSQRRHAASKTHFVGQTADAAERAAAPGGARAALRTQCRGLQTGIVGLPNVGKSSLFNALTENSKAEAANFPFCTIEPNVGKVKVPDKRLTELADLMSSQKIVPEFIEYVDIAGLVQGASRGEGLGNKFLGNIRNTDAIVHVVRCFEDEDVVHVDGSVDPRRDMETINLELIFADLDSCERRLKKVQKDIVGKVKGAPEEKEVLEKLIKTLEENKPARVCELTEKQEEICKGLCLITKKPVLYAGNVCEDDLATGNDLFKVVEEVAAETGDKAVMVSAQVEAELGGLELEERKDYLDSLGVEESGCESLTRATYKMLGLRTYFTVGPQEAHAWTIRAGWKAPKAAGVIHSDFEKGFIKAETISHLELLECGSEEEAKSKGLMRIEGKEYEVQEGDVMHFRFNV